MNKTMEAKEALKDNQSMKLLKIHVQKQEKPNLFDLWKDIYIIVNPNSEVSLAYIYQNYKDFVLSLDFIPLRKIGFSAQMKQQFKREIDRGQIYVHSNSKVKYEGLELKLDADLKKNIKEI